jgi:hypothetical protein
LLLLHEEQKSLALQKFKLSENITTQ